MDLVKTHRHRGPYIVKLFTENCTTQATGPAAGRFYFCTQKKQKLYLVACQLRRSKNGMPETFKVSYAIYSKSCILNPRSHFKRFVLFARPINTVWLDSRQANHLNPNYREFGGPIS